MTHARAPRDPRLRSEPPPAVEPARGPALARAKGRKGRGPEVSQAAPAAADVLDFYCHRARLCVEVDGAGHGFGDQPDRDAYRDRWLARKGIRTLRIRAVVVLDDVDNAVSMILEAAATFERKPPLSLRDSSP